MRSYFIILGISTLISSCGPNSDKNNPLSSKPSYCIVGKDEHGDNICSTGVLRFNTYEELCKGLQNEDLNSRCGFESNTERRRTFAQTCEGTFTPDYSTKMPPPAYEPCGEIVVRN